MSSDDFYRRTEAWHFVQNCNHVHWLHRYTNEFYSLKSCEMKLSYIQNGLQFWWSLNWLRNLIFANAYRNVTRPSFLSINARPDMNNSVPWTCAQYKVWDYKQCSCQAQTSILISLQKCHLSSYHTYKWHGG